MRLLDALLSTWRGNSTLPAAEQLSYLAVESAKVEVRGTAPGMFATQ